MIGLMNLFEAEHEDLQNQAQPFKKHFNEHSVLSVHHQCLLRLAFLTVGSNIVHSPNVLCSAAWNNIFSCMFPFHFRYYQPHARSDLTVWVTVSASDLPPKA